VKSRILAVAVLFWVLLAPASTPAQTQGMASPHLAAVVNLENLLTGEKTARVEVGGGVTLELAAGQGMMRQNLTILAEGRRLKQLEGGRFIACARLEAGPATYWAIFLARAAADQPVRFLGQTRGYNGGPRDFPGSFQYRQGQLYFEGYDNRFDYFHASHADCLLVNVPRFYYHLTPTGLQVDNIPFKEVYLNEVAAVDQKVYREAAPQDVKLEAILRPGSLPGFENMRFSDILGQLLVKRTILYLYAREDQKAWDTFSRDVARYYRTSDWVPQLRQEILKLMRSLPY
jgi:hypothetical protein